MTGCGARKSMSAIHIGTTSRPRKLPCLPCSLRLINGSAWLLTRPLRSRSASFTEGMSGSGTDGSVVSARCARHGPARVTLESRCVAAGARRRSIVLEGRRKRASARRARVSSTPQGLHPRRVQLQRKRGVDAIPIAVWGRTHKRLCVPHSSSSSSSFQISMRHGSFDLRTIYARRSSSDPPSRLS